MDNGIVLCGVCGTNVNKTEVKGKLYNYVLFECDSCGGYWILEDE